MVEDVVGAASGDDFSSVKSICMVDVVAAEGASTVVGAVAEVEGGSANGIARSSCRGPLSSFAAGAGGGETATPLARRTSLSRTAMARSFRFTKLVNSMFQDARVTGDDGD